MSSTDSYSPRRRVGTILCRVGYVGFFGFGLSLAVTSDAKIVGPVVVCLVAAGLLALSARHDNSRWAAYVHRVGVLVGTALFSVPVLFFVIWVGSSLDGNPRQTRTLAASSSVAWIHLILAVIGAFMRPAPRSVAPPTS